MSLKMSGKMKKSIIFLFVFAQVLLAGMVCIALANEKANIEFEQEVPFLMMAEKDNGTIVLEKPVISEEPIVQKGNPFQVQIQEKTPLTLDECITVAIKNSKDIEISLEKIELAKLKKNVAFRDLFPSMALSWSDTKGEPDETSFGQSDYEGTQYGLEAEHEIWPRDFVKYSYKQAGKNLEFNEISHHKTREDLIYEVKKAFYELAKTKRDARESDNIMNEALALRDMVEKQKKSDLINQLEYLKAVARYEELESQRKSQGYLIELAEVKLRTILKLDEDIFGGIAEGALFVVKEEDLPSIEKDKEEGMLVGYITTALSNRLEIEMQDAKLEFYEYGEKAVKGQGKPKISLINSFKEVGDAYEPDEIEYEEEWFIGSKISIPWFGNSLEYSYETGRSVPNRTSTYSTSNESDTIQQSGKLSILNNLPYYYDRKEAEVAYQSAINEKEEQIKKVILEVTEAYYTYKNSLNKALAGRDKLKFAVKQEEITDVLRQLGEETISRSMDVLVELQEAQFYYHQALFEYYVSILELNKAVGTELVKENYDKKAYF